MQPIKIIVCGDFRAAHPEKIGFSDEVASLFADADLRICNFEAPIHTKGAKPIEKSGPALDQSVNSPLFLKEQGFNVILMANNHIMDYGEAGMKATIDSFKDAIVVGAGTAKEAFSVRYVNVKEKTIGLLSLTQREFGTVESIDSEECGAAWINSPDVPNIIIQAKRKCDYLIVFPHAGVEHTSAPLPEWRRLYKRFIEWGADIVVASHPHCPQGWETDHGKPIYYSLGDFYFDELSYDDLWYKSIALELTIDEIVQTKEHYLCFDDKTGEISVDNSERIHKHIKYANNLLKDSDIYMTYINKMCSAHWVGYKYGLLRGLCGVTLKMKAKYVLRLLGCMLLGNTDESYLLNAIRCESHQWVMQRALVNRNKKNKKHS